MALSREANSTDVQSKETETCNSLAERRGAARHHRPTLRRAPPHRMKRGNEMKEKAREARDKACGFFKKKDKDGRDGSASKPAAAGPSASEGSAAEGPRSGSGAGSGAEPAAISSEKASSKASSGSKGAELVIPHLLRALSSASSDSWSGAEVEAGFVWLARLGGEQMIDRFVDALTRDDGLGRPKGRRHAAIVGGMVATTNPAALDALLRLSGRDGASRGIQKACREGAQRLMKELDFE